MTLKDIRLVQITGIQADAIDARWPGMKKSKRMVRMQLTFQRSGEPMPQKTDWYTLSVEAAKVFQEHLARAIALAEHPEGTGPSGTSH